MSTQVAEQSTVVAPKKRIRTIISSVLTYAFYVIIAAFLLFAIVIPHIIGARVMTVLTGSMEPNLPVGDMIVSQPVDVDTLQPGDIIDYLPSSNWTGGLTITHRVQSMVKTGGHVTQITVKGDANPVADQPITPDQIKGKVVYTIPLAGYPSLITHKLFDQPVVAWSK